MQTVIFIFFVQCRLFTKSREAVTPVYYKKLEKWNQVWDRLVFHLFETYHFILSQYIHVYFSCVF